MSKLNEVAKLAGVSKSTVSKVINHSESVSSQARQKVLDAMQALHYHAHELKRSPESPAMLGLILPFGKQVLSHSFGFDILAGAEEKAYENDYMILIGNSIGGREPMLTASMVNRGVEGLILLSVGYEQRLHLDMLKTSGVPLVLVDQKLEALETHHVRGDNFLGAVTLMKHLFRLGHNRVALVSPQKHFTHKERLKGYRYALIEQGIQLPGNYEILQRDDLAYLTQLEDLLHNDDRPTALFVTAPEFLVDVIGLLNRKQLRIPEDISLVTFDDTYTVLPEGYQDFFTSIIQPGKLMGSMAVELLLQHWRNPGLEYQEVVLPGKLNVRRSTRSL